ncbi:MAG: cytochrome PufQ [Silicimonas sp.]|nr:cytochrome PufQ [Silicimonas sp.]
MSDHTSDFSSGTARRPGGLVWEYRFYFVTIFLCALPFALGGVILTRLGLVRPGLRHGGVIKRALSEAHAITPMIFMR